MKEIIRKFKDDPIFAAAIMVSGVTALATLLKASANLIGSTGYAIHAAKRK